MKSKIKESVDLRIDLHRRYTEDVIANIMDELGNNFNLQEISFNDEKKEIYLASYDMGLTSDIVRDRVDHILSTMTSYDSPSLLYNLLDLSNNKFIISL